MFIFILLVARSANADDSQVINLLEIVVSVDGISVSVNVSTDYKIHETKNGVCEIEFLKCGVNILGKNRTSVSFLMPFFESIELESYEPADVSIMRLKLKPGYTNLSVQDSKYLNKIEFSFKAEFNEIKGYSFQVKNEPKAIEEDITSHELNTMDDWEMDSPEVALASAIIPVPIAEPIDLLPREILKYPAPMPEYPSPKNVVSLEEQEEPDVYTFKASRPSFNIRKARLEAIHYSQGRIDRDIITFEFNDISPSFNYANGEPGKVVIIFHNLDTPMEILPDNESRCEVAGTYLKSIGLMRFYEKQGPALKVVFRMRKPVRADVDDLGGIMDIIFHEEKD